MKKKLITVGFIVLTVLASSAQAMSGFGELADPARREEAAQEIYKSAQSESLRREVVETIHKLATSGPFVRMTAVWALRHCIESEDQNARIAAVWALRHCFESEAQGAKAIARYVLTSYAQSNNKAEREIVGRVFCYSVMSENQDTREFVAQTLHGLAKSDDNLARGMVAAVLENLIKAWDQANNKNAEQAAVVIIHKLAMSDSQYAVGGAVWALSHCRKGGGNAQELARYLSDLIAKSKEELNRKRLASDLCSKQQPVKVNFSDESENQNSSIAELVSEEPLSKKRQTTGSWDNANQDLE
ncbi:MAG: hypothetical protein ACD_5C00147G0001 [uncultured bacterium]|nr:MAG: hypothetical protein ACD_5C00147G0001 [uncultured bacterium]